MRGMLSVVVLLGLLTGCVHVNVTPRQGPGGEETVRPADVQALAAEVGQELQKLRAGIGQIEGRMGGLENRLGSLESKERARKAAEDAEVQGAGFLEAARERERQKRAAGREE